MEILKDYSPVPEDMIEICKEIQAHVDEQQYSIVTINGNEKEWGNVPKIFSYFNGKYYTQEYIGVLEYEGKKIAIHSRFDNGEKQFFLQYVFSKAFGINANIFNEMRLFAEEENTWDILLFFVYLQELKQALKKGYYKVYRQFSYNDCKVKGQIDFARHIKYNIPANGRIAYNTREYTLNNIYNVLFLKAYECMNRKYPDLVRNIVAQDFDLKKQLQYLKNEAHDYRITNNIYILNRTEKKIIHTIYKDYEQLRITSRLILRRMGLNSMSDGSSKVTGLVINMTKLWEDFLYKVICSKIGTIKVQEKTSVLEGCRIFKPDFYSEEKHLVLDAKYRKAWGETLGSASWTDLVRDDVFQVFAYMFARKCNKGGVVFPVEEEGNKNTIEKLRKKISAVLPEDYLFYRIPYWVPKKEKYVDFVKSMEETNKNIIAELLESDRRHAPF